MKSQKIIAVHLLNDFSGSPLVFRQALQSLKSNYDIELLTATPSGEGFLSNIPHIKQTNIFYKWSSNKLVTLFLFLYSQWQLFWLVRKKSSKGNIVYINTLLPFGAALAAISKKCTVVYHIHEVSVKPALLKSFLVFIVEKTASKILFVSKYVASQFSFKKPTSITVYNALPETFVEQTKAINIENTSAPFTVLMLCSLKAYKGVYEYIKIAKALPKIKFLLVLNTTQTEVDKFKSEVSPSENCILYSAQKDTIQFYKQAHLVMNLSRPDQWIETFGMTVLEAMYCGRPVIVPPVGGVVELVDDGVEGYRIDSRNLDEVIRKIENITTNYAIYKRLSLAAYKKANSFSQAIFQQQLMKVFGS